MEKIKQIANHPLSKAVIASIIGTLLLLESHPFYSGLAFGISIREVLLAFKTD